MGTPGLHDRTTVARRRPTSPATTGHRRASSTMSGTTTNQRAAGSGSTTGRRSSQPDDVHWCDGSAEEYDQLCAGAGRRRAPSPRSTRPSGRTATGPTPTPATSPASRTARSSAREREDDAGPNNNWRDPAEMRAELQRPVPRRDAGPHDVRRAVLDGPARLAASPTSACSSPTPPTSRSSMRIMTRMGQAALDVLGDDGEFVPCVHSVGAPLARRRGRRAVAVQPRQQVHRPLPRDPRDLVATAPATAATPCSARSASPCASPR